MDPNVFLSPFLEVVRSEDTSGPITGIALTSLSKFLSYGLVGTTCSESAAAAVENIAGEENIWPYSKEKNGLGYEL